VVIHRGDQHHAVGGALGGQHHGIGPLFLAHAADRVAHVLGVKPLDLHASVLRAQAPTDATMRNCLCSGTSLKARTFSAGRLCRVKRDSTGRSAGGTSSTAGSPPASWPSTRSASAW